jgi:hypothetical protein
MANPPPHLDLFIRLPNMFETLKEYHRAAYLYPADGFLYNSEATSLPTSTIKDKRFWIPLIDVATGNYDICPNRRTAINAGKGGELPLPPNRTSPKDVPVVPTQHRRTKIEPLNMDRRFWLPVNRIAGQSYPAFRKNSCDNSTALIAVKNPTIYPAIHFSGFKITHLTMRGFAVLRIWVLEIVCVLATIYPQHQGALKRCGYVE